MDTPTAVDVGPDDLDFEGFDRLCDELFGDLSPDEMAEIDSQVEREIREADSGKAGAFELCGPRPTNGGRRGRGHIRAIKDAILEALEVDQPMTVRQVFYRLVCGGVIDKTEGEYKSTVVRLLGEMRREGEIPFGWIADNSRWMRKPQTHSSLETALRNTARTYRRSVWDNQDAYVEVWLEKEALAGVLLDVTARWDVPLMVTRGYPSLSFLHAAAEVIRSTRKPTHLYYFGDHDPSGQDIPRAVHEGILEFAPGVDLTFTRVAVNRDQVASMGLVTRPTKASDSRSKRFEGESVEVDAIPPNQLRAIAEGCITNHVDRAAYERLMQAEAMERETMGQLADWYERRDN